MIARFRKEFDELRARRKPLALALILGLIGALIFVELRIPLP